MSDTNYSNILKKKEKIVLDLLASSDKDNTVEFKFIQKKLGLKKTQTHTILKKMIARYLINKLKKGQYYISNQITAENYINENNIINQIQIEDKQIPDKKILLLTLPIMIYSMILIVFFKILFSSPILSFISFFIFIVLMVVLIIFGIRFNTEVELKINYDPDFFSQDKYKYLLDKILDHFMNFLNSQSNHLEELLDKIKIGHFKSISFCIFTLDIFGLAIGFFATILSDLTLFAVTFCFIIVRSLFYWQNSEMNETFNFHSIMFKKIRSKWIRLKLLINTIEIQNLLGKVEFDKFYEKKEEIKRKIEIIDQGLFKSTKISGFISFCLSILLLGVFYMPNMIFIPESVLFILPLILYFTLLLMVVIERRTPEFFYNIEGHLEIIKIYIRCIRLIQRENQ